MATDSTTETGADQSSSDIDNESLLDNQQQQSAEEQQDTGSSDSQSQDSGSASDDTSNGNSGSDDDDDGLAKFAKGQGIDDISTLTDRERQLLKVARDNQRDFHEKRVKESDEARKAVEEVHQADETDEYDDPVLARVASIEAKADLMDFYQAHPEARDYDAEMGQILLQEAERYGKPAARVLAQNKERLLREAKSLRGDNDADAAREAGRREEREILRKRQEGSADTGAASDRSQTSNSKVTSDWVANEYDPTNPKHIAMLDEALAAGDLY